MTPEAATLDLSESMSLRWSPCLYRVRSKRSRLKRCFGRHDEALLDGRALEVNIVACDTSSRRCRGVHCCTDYVGRDPLERPSAIAARGTRSRSRRVRARIRATRTGTGSVVPPSGFGANGALHLCRISRSRGYGGKDSPPLSVWGSELGTEFQSCTPSSRIGRECQLCFNSTRPRRQVLRLRPCSGTPERQPQNYQSRGSLSQGYRELSDIGRLARTARKTPWCSPMDGSSMSSASAPRRVHGLRPFHHLRERGCSRLHAHSTNASTATPAPRSLSSLSLSRGPAFANVP